MRNDLSFLYVAILLPSSIQLVGGKISPELKLNIREMTLPVASNKPVYLAFFMLTHGQRKKLTFKAGLID